MNDMTFRIMFEVYLVASTTFLFLALLNRRIKRVLSTFDQAFRPNWSERHFQLLKIFLLIVFVPLTIFNTMDLLGIPPWSLR